MINLTTSHNNIEIIIIRKKKQNELGKKEKKIGNEKSFFNGPNILIGKLQRLGTIQSISWSQISTTWI